MNFRMDDQQGAAVRFWGRYPPQCVLQSGPPRIRLRPGTNAGRHGSHFRDDGHGGRHDEYEQEPAAALTTSAFVVSVLVVVLPNAIPVAGQLDIVKQQSPQVDV